MSFKLAIKAFMKAWKNPGSAKEFLEDKPREMDASDHTHLQLLSLLQESGRLIDFLKEDIGDFTDAQIGAAARKIHEDCGATLEEIVTIRPLMQENEGATIKIPQGYNPSMIKVVGNVKGEPPFTGVLIHKGWKAHKHSLPKKIGKQIADILCPAEVEIR